MPIPVISTIEEKDDNPFFAALRDTSIQGGLTVVDDVAARDAIYDARRKEGQHVYTVATMQTWRLVGGIENTDWVEVVDGSSYNVVANITARDAIPSSFRYEGLKVYVLDAAITFRLDGGIDDTDWTALKKQGGSAPYDLYLDPTGDDSAAGTSGDPIATLAEAQRRIPISGFDVNLYLSLGTFNKADNTAGGAGQRQALGTLDCQLQIFGTQTIHSSFTVLSTTENQVKSEGTPGWTVNEHTGRLATMGNGVAYPVISNTADTLTVVYSPNTDGGFIPPPPVSSTVDIIETTVIADALTNPSSYKNRLGLFGRVLVQDVFFSSDTWSINAEPLPGAEVGFQRCVFESVAGTGIAGGYGGFVGYCSACLFIGHGSAIDLAATGYWGVIGCGFVSCTFGLVCSGSGTFAFVSKFDVVCARSVGTLLRPRQNGAINDGSSRCHLDAVTNYVWVDRSGVYLRDGVTLTSFTGFGAPTYVIKLDRGGVDVDLFDSAGSNLAPTTSWFRWDTTDITLATYAAAGAVALDTKGNHVYG